MGESDACFRRHSEDAAVARRSENGHFDNDPRLSDNEISTIRTWADGGAPEGNPDDLPPAPRFAEGWKLGKPDLVYDIGQDYVVEATGPDENTTFTVDMKLDRDIWVAGVDLQPGNRKVVHHAHVKVISPVKPVAKSQAVIDPSLDLKNLMIREGTESWMKQDAPVIDDGCSHPGRRRLSGNRPGGRSRLGVVLPGVNPTAGPPFMRRRFQRNRSCDFKLLFAHYRQARPSDRTRVDLLWPSVAEVRGEQAARHSQPLLPDSGRRGGTRSHRLLHHSRGYATAVLHSAHALSRQGYAAW